MPRILVVEDNEDNRELLVEILETRGMEVMTAPDAPSGIDILRREPIDLILMDISLPGMNGFEATKKIKQDPRLSEVPVIVLTAYAMMEDKKKAFEAGCSGYLTKPLNFPVLYETLDRYLDPQKNPSKD